MVGTACVLALLSGCAPPAGASPDSSELAGQLAAAEAAGADESQLEILRGSEVTFEQYEAALNRTFACMEEAGLVVHRNGTKWWDGSLLVDYYFGAPEGTAPTTEQELMNRADACDRQYSYFVDTYWQAGTPEEDGFRERRAAALREPMAQCLRRNGVDFAADENMDELVSRALTVSGERPSVDCAGEIGYWEWNG